MIRPLIVDEGRKRGALAMAFFLTGALLSSSVVGVVLGQLGETALPGGTKVPLLAIAVVGIVLAVADLNGRTPTNRLQTKRTWWRRGPPMASLMWGVHLGAGFATIRVASLYWVVCLAIFASASPIAGLMMGAYGLGLALNLGAGMLMAPRAAVHYPLYTLVLLPPSRRLLAVLLVCWSVFVGIEAMA
jgi:hypothetical protein